MPTPSPLVVQYFSIQVNKAGHGFSVGNALSFNGTYVLASGANMAGAITFIGFVVRVIDANNFILQYGGLISNLSGLITGTRYFLDPVTSGNITSTYPSTTGQVARPVLMAISASSGYMLNQNPIMSFPNNRIQYRTGTESYSGVTLIEGNNMTITQDGAGNYTITGKLNQTVNEINLPGVNISVSGGSLVFGGVIPLLVPGLSTTQDLIIKNGKTLKWDNVGDTFYTGWKAGANTANYTFTQPIAFPTISGSSMVSDITGVTSFAPIPGHNMIQNGDFQWWQRGAGGAATKTITNTTVYFPDRWQIKSSGAATTAVFTQSPGPTSGSYYCKVQRQAANAGTDAILLAESLPRSRCIDAAGNFVTLSFTAFKGANYSVVSNAISVQILSGTGTNDVSAITTGFTGQAIELTQSVVITTVPTRYSVTVPAALGATITQLAASFSFIGIGTAGADDSFSITNIKWELGKTATPFEHRNELLELQERCWKTFNYGTAPAQGVGETSGELIFPSTQVGAATQVMSSVRYPTIMPLPRTVTTYNPSSANAQFYNETQGADCSSTIVLQNSDNALTLITDGPVSTLVGDAMGIHLLVEAELN